MSEYSLKCLHKGCGKIYRNVKERRLMCDNEINGKHGPSLLRAVYNNKRINIHNNLPGIFPYSDWLPTGNYYIDQNKLDLGVPKCYKSIGLSERLGLKNLYISFSGWNEKIGSNLVTRAFKEFDSQASIVNLIYSSLHNGNSYPYCISSAGNAATAFAVVSEVLNLPIYIFVPKSAIGNLILPFKVSPFLVVVDGDYTDATVMADKVAKRVSLIRDGGIRNVARRAGMGTVMLNAVTDPISGSGRIYDHYFQAVGSASGAIASWEAVKLLMSDGRYGSYKTKIHMSQNLPFSPIVNAWNKGLKSIDLTNGDFDSEIIDSVTASVLTNRSPPYSLTGGVYDTLNESKGFAWPVSNLDLFQAARIFMSYEGVDISAASAVSVSSLMSAVKSGSVKSDDYVLLHITGGGQEVQHMRSKVYPIEPTIFVGKNDIEKVVECIGKPDRIELNSKLIKEI